MSKTKITLVVFCVVVSASGFLSCRKSGQPSWNAQILAPIVNASLSINDIITSKYITANPDSSVSLVYTDSLYTLNMDTLLNIPDTVIRYDTAWPLPPVNVNPGGVLFVTPITTSAYNLGGVELVKGILMSGYLTYTLRNPLSQPIDYSYKVYNITNGTDTLVIRRVVNAGTTIKDSIFLGGYNVDFTGPHYNGYNDITANIQVTLDPKASALTIKTFDTLVAANITFKKVIPYYAQGYFGTTTKTFGPENVAFPVFGKIMAGSLNLQNVSVNLSLVNGFGVDARLVLSQLSSYNKLTNTTVNLSAPGVINSTINVNRAAATHNQASPVNPSIMNFSLSPSNSNILAWLDNLPTSIGYALQVTTDPLGNVSGFNDFAYYGYGINSNISVVIPLSMIATNLTLADTLAVNFAGSGNVGQHVKSGTLTLYASNGFPFSAGLQLYLLNKNNMVSDSLFIPAQTIASAPVNAITGIATSPQSSVLTISLDANHTEELLNTKTIILYARFNMGSAPSTYRKIYDYYKLGIKLVGNFNYQVN